MTHGDATLPQPALPVAAAGIHFGLMALQPVWAGLILAGSAEAMALHLWTARAAMLACGLLLAGLVTAWRVGLAPAGLTIRAALLLAGELVQYGLGEAGHPALHVPLGAMLLVGAAMVLRDLVGLARRAL